MRCGVLQCVLGTGGGVLVVAVCAGYWWWCARGMCLYLLLVSVNMFL